MMNCDKEMKIFSKRSSEITVMVALWLARWALEFDVKGLSPDQICFGLLERSQLFNTDRVLL